MYIFWFWEYYFTEVVITQDMGQVILRRVQREL